FVGTLPDPAGVSEGPDSQRGQDHDDGDLVAANSACAEGDILTKLVDHRRLPMKAKLFYAAAVVTTCAFLLSAPLAAQWVNFKTLGIPRSPDGRPDRTAPVPRPPDGTRDLSAIGRVPGGS